MRGKLAACRSFTGVLCKLERREGQGIEASSLLRFLALIFHSMSVRISRRGSLDDKGGCWAVMDRVGWENEQMDLKRGGGIVL